LSHDLRSPLGTILNWVSLLRAAPEDKAHLARGIEVIERNVRLQMKLIDDLLDVSRDHPGKALIADSGARVERRSPSS